VCLKVARTNSSIPDCQYNTTDSNVSKRKNGELAPLGAPNFLRIGFFEKSYDATLDLDPTTSSTVPMQWPAAIRPPLLPRIFVPLTLGLAYQMWAILGKPSPLICLTAFEFQRPPNLCQTRLNTNQHFVGHFEITVAQPAKSGGSHLASKLTSTFTVQNRKSQNFAH